MSTITHEKNLPPQISAHDKIALFRIAIEMRQENFSEEFVANAVETALEFEGVADLILMWGEEDDPKERDEIIADIQELIVDCNQLGKKDLPQIYFNDLDAVAQNIRVFKDSLLSEVDARGGITKLAEKTGIPQPSLSRFFNSNAMPHRVTLLKIAKALNLDAIPITNSWEK